MNHYGHIVLGKFCWTCQFRTQSAIPGWSSSDNTNLSTAQFMCVIWKDSTRNHMVNCVECKAHTCKYPVTNERYREIWAKNRVPNLPYSEGEV